MRFLFRAAVAIAIFATFTLAQEDAITSKIDHPIRHVSGVVQKAGGEGVPNIDVEVFTAVGHSIVASTKTDGHGKFSTEKVDPGEYEVWFTYKPHPVFKDVMYKVTVDPKGSKEPLVVKLQSLPSAAPTP
jgi:Carboxypeptidase regulatory-like domain